MPNANTAPSKRTPAFPSGYVKGMRRAYVAGARSGRLAGFLWGTLLGAAAVAAALKLGWLAGAA